MRMLTRHGDEIAGKHFQCTWAEYKDEVTPVDVTPVQKFAGQNLEAFQDCREDFGSVRPPWTMAWVEYVVQADNSLKRAGMDVHMPAPEEVKTMKERMSEETYQKLFFNEEVDLAFPIMAFVDEGDRWIEEGFVWTFLDEDGRVVSDPDRRFFPVPFEGMRKACKTDEEARQILLSRIISVLLGFSFCHCPNVTLWEDEKPEPVREKRKASGKNPGQTFKCLNIEPLKEEIRSKSARSGEGETDRREHVVRGHFRYYSEEKPLFGHYSGNVWIPEHTRGDEEKGRVEKSYRVDEPRSEARGDRKEGSEEGHE